MVSIKYERLVKSTTVEAVHIKPLMGGIDLHIHSTASDGTLSPEAIVQLALKKKLSAIAITDHDTVGGVQQILKQGIPTEIHFISGVEISIEAPDPFKMGGSLHLLGYGFNPFDGPLNNALKQLQDSRKNRTPKMIAKLNQLGIPISLEQVTHKESVAGRPHIATVLLEMGYVKNFDEAFEHYLGHDKPAYVQRLHLSAKEAIKLIRNAGGIAAIAHLGVYFSLGKTSRKKLLTRLKELGLQGVEVFYPSHSPAVTRELQSLAESMNLVMTGGTDFHGDIRPGLQLGTGNGSFWVPEVIYEKLSAAIKGFQPS